MRTCRLHTMQPSRQHQEFQLENNEIENLTNRLNNLSETATAEVNVGPDTVEHDAVDNQQSKKL